MTFLFSHVGELIGIEELEKKTSGIWSDGTNDGFTHPINLGKPFYTLSYNDQTEGMPWYCIGFKDNNPFLSGYYGMIFRAATGRVTMGSDGRMTGPGFIQSSDRRLKSDINELGSILDKIKQLKPCSYILNSDKTRTERIGLIAQEVEEIFPQFVFTDKDGYKGIDYASMVALCIKAIQELG